MIFVFILRIQGRRSRGQGGITAFLFPFLATKKLKYKHGSKVISILYLMIVFLCLISMHNNDSNYL
jgi:hypothetical protein